MKKNGFVTSALLYGMLSLFLVLIIGTVSIIGNRKLSSDKIKQITLDDVQDLITPESCFETDTSLGGAVITEYKTGEGCTVTVFIPEKIRGYVVTGIGANAFRGRVTDGVVTFRSNIDSISSTAFSGNSKVIFINKGSNPIPGETSGTLWGATNSYLRQD